MKTWEPILSPASQTAARARAAIDAIANATWSKDYPPPIHPPLNHRLYEDSLLYAYLAAACKDDQWADRAIEQLNQEIETLNALQHGLGLHGGLCGLGWVMQHVTQLLSEPSSDSAAEDDDPNRDIDAAVLKTLRTGAWSREYDLISGLVGFGIYFMERLPRELAADGLRLVVTHLETLSESTVQGIAWHTRPAQLPDWQRERCPAGYYNLGVAHGIPGVVQLLSETAAAGIEVEKCQYLLGSAMEWLIAQQRPAGSLSRFSCWVAPGESADARLTWCYGDLGIVAVMLQVARRAGREDWMEFAHNLLDHCLAWPVESTGIADAPLCHGAIGAAHIFNRIYQTGQDHRCYDASIAWFERALDMRQSSGGVAGFLQQTLPDVSGPVIWEASPAFLDGAGGIALALLSATTALEPNWDRLLLLSGRSSCFDQVRSDNE